MTFQACHRGEALTSESPVWDARRGVLWYIDIQGQRLLGRRLDGPDPDSLMLPLMPGFVCLTTRDDLLLGLEDGLWLLTPDTGGLRRHLAVEAEDTRTRLNEGKADADGRLWFGTMDKTGPFGAIGALYCLPPGGPLRCIRQGVGVPNAIDVTPDGNRLYFADSRLRRIERFPLNRETGELGAPEIFAVYPEGEAPDGALVDAEGTLWVAVVGGARIDRFDLDGTRLPPVAVPVSRPTSLTFGGADLMTLFVTSQRRFLSAGQLTQRPLAGALLTSKGLGRGRPPRRVQLLADK